MPEISSFSIQTPIEALRDLLLSHEPAIHARMTEPNYDAKYLRMHTPITDADLAAHLAGDITLACVLQRDERSSIAACDIDTGGEAMVRRVMRAAELRACHAYGYVLDSGQHCGGHVWIFFERAHAISDLQVLMRDILTEAQCLSTEVYPTNADLRLPFGLHRHCGRLRDISVDELALMTAGLSLRHLEDLLLRAAHEGGVTQALVKARKDRIIASAYTDVAEMIEPLAGGFADIGGMDTLKAWSTHEIIAPIRAGRIHDVPKGVLLVGPPGSGKTYFVRGLAAEIGFNAVALRAERILGSLVGQSEARLARFFAFCRALAPVLVFVDEIDQSDMARRGSSSGNPVAANLFNQMLQFMSDETLRGRVIVVFATNRPDLLDPALLRSGRMDAIVPVLLPDNDERRAIVRAQAHLQGSNLDTASLELLSEATHHYSSSDLAALVRKARAYATRMGYDHITHDAAHHALATIRPTTLQLAEYYTLLAVAACNDSEYLPPAYAALLADRSRLQQLLRQAQQEVDS